MKRKDLKAGDCYMSLVSGRPIVVANKPLLDRPLDWGWSLANLSSTPAEFHDREVELLEHYSTHPTPTPKNLRQTAMPASFGVPDTRHADPTKPRSGEAVAGWAPAYGLFERAMRVEGNWHHVQGRKTVVGLTFEQTEACRVEWSRRLREKVDAKKAEDARKDHEQVVIERDHWEVD